MNHAHDSTVCSPMHNLATAHGSTHDPVACGPTVCDSMHNLATHCPAAHCPAAHCPATHDLTVCD